MRTGPTREVCLQRRSAVRYRLRLPVIFHWNDGVEHMSGGFTSDLALNGAFILSRECPPLGSEVHLEVLFPSPDKENEEVRIGCSGKVIHLSKTPGVCAFGFQGVFQENQLTRQVLQFRNTGQAKNTGQANLSGKAPVMGRAPATTSAAVNSGESAFCVNLGKEIGSNCGPSAICDEPVVCAESAPRDCVRGDLRPRRQGDGELNRSGR